MWMLPQDHWNIFQSDWTHTLKKLNVNPLFFQNSILFDLNFFLYPCSDCLLHQLRILSLEQLMHNKFVRSLKFHKILVNCGSIPNQILWCSIIHYLSTFPSLDLNLFSGMQQDEQFPFNNLYDWKSKSFLGQGSFGKVFKVRNIKDGQFYALKQMNMTDFNRDQTLMSSLKGQIQITMDVNSEHTVRMIDAKIGHNYTYIVLELCDNDLRKEMASKKFTQAECVTAFDEIMQGFNVLVSKGYIHRDVKPANTLVKNHHYKVADFGFACKADVFGKKKLNDICGTPIYMAPQLLKNESYTAKSDIWSLGLMLYEMIFGYPPWPCRSLDQYLFCICNKPLTFPYNAKIGQNTRDFLQRSLVIDEQKRLGWNEVFNHPLIKKKQVGSMIQQLMISKYVKGIVQKLQEYISTHNIKWSYFIKKYSKLPINFQVFQQFIKEIDPFISTHEITVLFQHLDNSKSGEIKWAIIENYIAKVDFRSTDDVLSRKVDEIVAILKDKKADPVKIFQEIDLNHSGSLDFSEFNKFILKLAPRYTKEEILQLFKLFDSNLSGVISRQEFLDFLGKRMPAKLPGNATIQRGRAENNLNQLRSYIKWSGIDAQAVLKIADKDHSHTVDIGELSQLLKSKFKFNISHQEVAELFAVINKSQSNQISLEELAEILK